MSYGGGSELGKVNTQWSLAESRTFAVGAERFEPGLREAIRLVGGDSSVEEPIGRWRWNVDRSLSLYDHCEIEVQFRVEGESSSVVDARVTFDASVKRVGAFLFLAQSIVGLPLLYLWRWRSVHGARAFAAAFFTGLWRPLSRGMSGQPYR